MLPKAGKDRKVITNYRPISLLPTLGKLMERILNSRIMRHLIHEGYFNNIQRGFIPKKNASEILYKLTEEIVATKDANKQVCNKPWATSVFSLDVEKAFDSAWHNAIRFKLHTAVLPPKILRILSSFLTKRTLRVRSASEVSNAVEVKAETTQRNVIRPLLYLVYVNDVPIESSGLRGGQYADDLNGWESYRNAKRGGAKLQRGLTDTENWARKWRIKLNADKTQLTTFSQRKITKSYGLK